jgi:hypothetical protein
MSELKNVTVNVTMAEWEEMYNAKKELEKYKDIFDNYDKFLVHRNNVFEGLNELYKDIILYQPDKIEFTVCPVEFDHLRFDATNKRKLESENYELKIKLNKIQNKLEQIKNLI